MKSSPDLRRWAAWWAQAKTKASWTLCVVDLDRGVGGVLGDDREQVAQQPALGGAQAEGLLLGACRSGPAVGLLERLGGDLGGLGGLGFSLTAIHTG